MDSSLNNYLIHRKGNIKRIHQKSMRIFIPFIDGILKNDCKKCKDNCCIEFGRVYMNRREWKILSKEYPFIKHFVIPTEKRPRVDSSMQIRRYQSCWFLTQNGLCSIHKRYGYKLKPLICRVHPYYVYKCNGEYIISPIGYCKASLVIVRNIPKNIKLEKGNERVLRNAKDIINSGCSLHPQINWSKERFALEKRVFYESKCFLNKTNYIDFVIRQMRMVEKNESLEVIKQQVMMKLKLWQQFLRIENITLKNRVITYELTAITTLLRIKENRINEKVIPIVLLALYILVLLFSRSNKNKIIVNTYVAVLNLAKKMIFLMDNRKTKIALLSYLGVRKKHLLTLAGSNSIIDLAEKFQLNTEERIGFIHLILAFEKKKNSKIQ